MFEGIWGKKIGMTQLFSQNNKVVPVTAIDVANWVVTQIKRDETDGYTAVKVGIVRKRYAEEAFSPEWLKQSKKFFELTREIKCSEIPEDIQVGVSVAVSPVVEEGGAVNVFGTTKGKGFQGVVKRHKYSGGKASHGPRFGRLPGSIGFMCSQGRVIKGKKMPGHMGCAHRVMKNLEIVKVEPEKQVVFVKGSIPGHVGSLVYMQKA